MIEYVPEEKLHARMLELGYRLKTVENQIQYLNVLVKETHELSKEIIQLSKEIREAENKKREIENLSPFDKDFKSF